jgi:hypothetical protein
MPRIAQASNNLLGKSPRLFRRRSHSDPWDPWSCDVAGANTVAACLVGTCGPCIVRRARVVQKPLISIVCKV